MDLIIRGAAEIFTATGNPLKGAAIGVRDGLIAWIGPDEDAPRAVREFDARGKLVTPGLVDCHTHIVFAGDRADEYAMRAAGKSYLEIAEAGGGIANTMKATRAAEVETLVELARPRLDALLANGVTTAEIKSGYGLDLATELRMLKAAHALGVSHSVDVVGTFLGAHTIPPEHKKHRARYLSHVIEEMIPAVATAGLAEFCDVFVERSAFSIEEGERVLTAGLEHGLRPKVHADQLSPLGGAELAARVGAVSADHLEHISDAGIAALARSGTVAVLLPGAGVFLDEEARPPARKLIEAGVPVALSTDCNPGTCMSENLLLMLTLGMSRLKMSPREVLEAVTINAARAIGREGVAGQIALGRPADIAVFAVPSHKHLPYHFGAPHTHTVFKRGEVAYARTQ